MFTKLKKDYCPHCEKQLAAHYSIEGEHEPKPGDLTVCVFCTTFLFYNKKLRLEKLSQLAFSTLNDEIKMLLTNTRKAIVEKKKTMPLPS